MAKKYLTPDFDVTVYEIKDVIAGPTLGDGDADDEKFNGEEMSWNGDIFEPEW